jgi:branched-chain amino acid transport system permease protein
MSFELIPSRYLRQTHRDCRRMLPFRSQQVGMLALAAVLLAAPQSGNGYVIGIMTQTAIAVVGAIGLNFIVGFTGQLAIGQAAYMAIGAYTTAILAGKFHVPFVLAVLGAGAITAVASALVALPTLRLRGFYLAMATFAVHFMTILLVSRWSYVGGQSGVEVPRPDFARGDVAFFFAVCVAMALLVHVAFNIEQSFLGRAWGAIRDRDLAAAATGISLARFKVWSHGLSGLFVGITGGLFAAFMGYITPEHFPFFLTIQYLGMILVGGLGTVLGSIFGAVFMTVIPELIRLVGAGILERTALPVTYLADAQLILFGTIIIVTLLFAPKGLFGLWEDTKTYFKTWPFSY